MSFIFDLVRSSNKYCEDVHDREVIDAVANLVEEVAKRNVPQMPQKSVLKGSAVSSTIKKPVQFTPIANVSNGSIKTLRVEERQPGPGQVPRVLEEDKDPDHGQLFYTWVDEQCSRAQFQKQHSYEEARTTKQIKPSYARKAITSGRALFGSILFSSKEDIDSRLTDAIAKSDKQQARGEFRGWRDLSLKEKKVSPILEQVNQRWNETYPQAQVELKSNAPAKGLRRSSTFTSLPILEEQEPQTRAESKNASHSCEKDLRHYSI